MSAIAGLIYFDGKNSLKAECQSMLDELGIFGRDGTAVWGDSFAALGICKMRTVPEDQFDTQPLIDSGRGLVLVADARIDNRDDLGRELGIEREVAAAMADPEFIMAAFKRWGDECLSKLIGDFAFAVYDSRNRSLFCAHDHLGMRPLNFHEGAGFFAFATMPQGLLALPRIPADLDQESLARHLALLPEVGTRTFFRSIARLPAAHSVSATPSGLRLHRYWDPNDIGTIRLSSDQEYIDALRPIWDEAVRCRLRAIGPVGSHLSGGMDSGSVTVTAARLLAEKGERLTAFTSVPRKGFRQTGYTAHFLDEGHYAAAVTAMYPNIDHVLIDTEGRSLIDSLDRDQRRMGRPIRNPTNILWLDAINEDACKRAIRTVLCGGWGNATLSYTGFESLSGLFRSGKWLALLLESRALMRVQGRRVLGLANVSFGPSLPSGLRRSLQRARGSEPWRYSALNPALIDELGLKPLDEMLFDAGYSHPNMNSGAYRSYLLRGSDMGAYSVGFAGAAGLDQRDPTGDKRLVEFCFAIPDDQFLHQGVDRRLVRRAMAGALPAAVLNEHRKGMQAGDWYETMAGSKPRIVEELVLIEQSVTARLLLDLPRMRAMVANWPQENWHSNDVYIDYALALQRGLAVGNFIRNFEAQ